MANKHASNQNLSVKSQIFCLVFLPYLLSIALRYIILHNRIETKKLKNLTQHLDYIMTGCYITNRHCMKHKSMSLPQIKEQLKPVTFTHMTTKKCK